MKKLLTPAVIIGCIIIICLTIFGFYYAYSTVDEEEVIAVAPVTKKEEAKPPEILFYVDIKGAVNKPGVYQVKDTARIIDVITAASGLTKDADTSITNLAYLVTDGLSFKIYTKKEVKTILNNEVATNDAICPTKNNTDCLISKEPTTPNETKEPIALISINTATIEELDTLNGIGPSIAAKIIEYRTTNGNFTVIEDIKNVSGIGDALFAKIKDYITI